MPCSSHDFSPWCLSLIRPPASSHHSYLSRISVRRTHFGVRSLSPRVYGLTAWNLWTVWTYRWCFKDLPGLCDTWRLPCLSAWKGLLRATCEAYSQLNPQEHETQRERLAKVMMCLPRMLLRTPPEPKPPEDGRHNASVEHPLTTKARRTVRTHVRFHAFCEANGAMLLSDVDATTRHRLHIRPRERSSQTRLRTDDRQFQRKHLLEGRQLGTTPHR